ncbi:MAG: hypothetical protein HFH43_07775 [Lachnospiraceae bacterium]|nr:hypothetical protein [Lachnospiraceae bacterium]
MIYNSRNNTFAQSSFTFQPKTLIGQISFIEKQVKETETEISGILGKLESPHCCHYRNLQCHRSGHP